MKYLFLLPLVIVSSLVKSQNVKYTDLPRGVRVNFETMYPGIQKSFWTLRDSNTYMGNFIDNKRNTEVQYTKQGFWVLTSFDTLLIAPTPEIKERLDKSYAGYVLKRVSRTIQPNGSNLWYIELMVATQFSRLLITSDGLVTWKQ